MRKVTYHVTAPAMLRSTSNSYSLFHVNLKTTQRGVNPHQLENTKHCLFIQHTSSITQFAGVTLAPAACSVSIGLKADAL